MGPISVISALVALFFIDKAINYQFVNKTRRTDLAIAYLIVAIPSVLIGIVALSIGI